MFNYEVVILFIIRNLQDSQSVWLIQYESLSICFIVQELIMARSCQLYRFTLWTPQSFSEFHRFLVRNDVKETTFYVEKFS